MTHNKQFIFGPTFDEDASGKLYSVIEFELTIISYVVVFYDLGEVVIHIL